MAKKKFFIKGQGIKKEVEKLKTKVEGLEAAISTENNKKVPRTRRKRTAIYSPPVVVEAKNVEAKVTYENSELEFPL